MQERCFNQPPRSNDASTDTISPILLQYEEHGVKYQLRHITWNDNERQTAYQQLRATTFIEQRKWDIPMDAEGRERDRYDKTASPTNRVFGVYGCGVQEEFLLGGLRIFSLYNWEDSMAITEFGEGGIIPEQVIKHLKEHYNCRRMLELNRMVIHRGSRYTPPSSPQQEIFSCMVARDLLYATACALTESSGREQSLVILDPPYYRIFLRNHFVLTELYRNEYLVLAIVDTWPTMRAMYQAVKYIQVMRMLALCRHRDTIIHGQQSDGQTI